MNTAMSHAVTARCQSHTQVCSRQPATQCMSHTAPKVRSQRQQWACRGSRTAGNTRTAMLIVRASATSAVADAAKEPQRPKPRIEEWQQVLDLQKAGEVVTGTIKAVNRGGVVVDVVGHAGFVPYSRLDVARLPKGAPGNGVNLSFLVGQPISAKIIQVNVPEKKIILSERAAMLGDLLAALTAGDVVEGVVTRLTDFGAFVSLIGADGKMHGTEGLIHISELSWDVVMTPESVVQAGTPVRCAVLEVNTNKGRISLSLKRLQDDPLQETLEAMLPREDGVQADVGAEVLGRLPEGVAQVCRDLQSEEGISAIRLGRQVEERRTVSQDLELYISKEAEEGGYTLVARAGRTVQEIYVTTELPLPEMKAAVQRVLKRLV